ncbi:PREDICTED: uncharacterized protein LOC104780944 isoform X2 [Camelina sativa]|uniref:Uncharacterized protein LOC104780944 isoform X1 n=1 Tax=Camelina sativa TaxID=90675 RepID=A0ABM1RMM1_CAMSA|nr:PREDICTED: uncharacterized protein LOC104780944 isoform X1 [Camelina sativa]XP_019100259.1 PREDICTED: uncharacterized protein LOC104780944 isoform X2 [Camelina sativa]
MNEGSSEEVTRTVMEEKPEQQRGSLEKGRSCKGYLYYSSTLKSKSKNPRCVGIPRTLRQVPDYVVGQSEAEASKEGRTLADFYYGCLGYSVYMTEKDSSTIKQHTKTQLPVCVGLEILADRKAASGNTSSVPVPVPARVQNRNESRDLPQHQNNKPVPATNTENGFLTRFTRNASLVASGVMKNMKRVGNYVKETVDDSLDPYRKRPK